MRRITFPRTPHPQSAPYGAIAGRRSGPPALRPLSSVAVLAAGGALALSCAGPAMAAPPGTVLAPGTVPVLRGVVSGAMVGAPTATATGNLLTVNQSAQRAIIDWTSFNIGSGSEVRFVQPNAGAAALNRIYDADPSIIQGRLSANGQVYLINQNGILFDRGSQVNVYGLVASTLGITDDIFTSGINKAPRGTPAFEGTNGLSRIDIGAYGPAGAGPAQITAQPGGSILVFAPQINNQDGIIKAPDGQVILAAGQKVYLSDNNPNDFTMRGLLVQVQADQHPLNLTSMVTNLGDISADRGNVTLAALAVNQMNRVSAKTAVLQNGSVWLQSPGGTVTLGANSRTETPLDTGNTTTLSDDQDYTQYRSVILAQGKTINVQGQVSAPGGVISLAASDPANPASTTSSRIYIDSGAQISAAGNWADLPLSKNLLQVRITSNELKDAPEQKGGLLLGKTVTVDLSKGPVYPMFDLSGYANAVQRTIGEKAAAGGEVALASQGDIIMRGGSVIDVSGGGYRYAGGLLTTTKLQGADGRVYDLSTASPDRQYTAVLDRFSVTSAKWGQTTAYTDLLNLASSYQAPFVQGQRGGVLSVVAGGGAVLAGALKGGITAGPNQMDAGKLPLGGQLILGKPTDPQAATQNYILNNVVFQNGGTDLAPGFDVSSALPADRAGTLLLSPGVLGTPAASASQYSYDGFGTLAVYANGRIEVPAGVAVNAPPTPAGATGALRNPEKGTVTFAANEIDLAGDVAAPGGVLSITARNTVAPVTGTPTVVAGPGSELSARGLWVNDTSGAATASATTPLAPRVLDGGSIRISTAEADLAPGSVLDVSGGARLSSDGKLTKGNAGGISVLGGGDDLQPAVVALGGEFRGYAAGKGGTLTLRGAHVQIGGADSGDPYTLHFERGFFETGGFAQYTLTGHRDLTIAADTALTPHTATLVIDTLAARFTPTGGDVRQFSTPTLLPLEQRTAAGVAFATTSDFGPGLLMQPGASIVTDPKGTVALSAKTALAVHGTIDAPAGSIALSLRAADAQFPDGTLLIGADAALRARGAFVAQPNNQGLAQGEVLGGGTIRLDALKNRIVTEAGSVLDVSGAAATLDLAQGSPAQPYRRTAVTSDAGAIVVTATQSVQLGGTLEGHAGGATSAGGTFTLDLLKHNDGMIGGDKPHRIIVTQANVAPAADPAYIDAAVSADSLGQGGFDKVRLRAQDVAEFRGSVALNPARSVQVDAPELRATGGGTVNLAASRVILGASGQPQREQAPAAAIPTATGTATLNVQAGLLDLYGSTTVNGVAQLNLTSSGDIRLTGRLVDLNNDAIPDRLTGGLTTPGSITLTAAQVYPTTFSDYTLGVKNVTVAGATVTEQVVPGGSITVERAGGPAQPVLSAGGKLTLQADTIVNDGTLRAPLGQIALNATGLVELKDGSITSVTGGTLPVPYGGTVSGQTWAYGGIPVTTTVDKQVSLSGQNVKLDAGAQVDLRGGGDLLGVEFVPGPGGSRDFLLQPNTYAVIPGLGAYAPYDTDLFAKTGTGFGTDKGLGIYDSVYLAAGAGLPAGTYALLPGYYGLLPGAYVVTPQTGTTYRDLQPGQTSGLLDGTPVVAGYRTVAGTGTRESRWSGFAVRPGAEARKASEYVLSGAGFFAAQAGASAAVALPADAGRASIAAQQSLGFDGTLLTAAAPGGRAAEVDITAQKIAVVAAEGQAGVPADYLQISAAKLSGLDASLLLGGTRSYSAQGTQLTVGAQQVLVANDAGSPLTGPEILLAAKDTVTLRAGSEVEGVGTYSGRTTPINIGAAGGPDGNGALVRAAAGPAVALNRTGVDRTRPGTLVVESGAVVQADRSLLLDATNGTQFFGTLALGENASVTLGAGRISVGETAGVSGGFVLSDALLAALPALDGLTLRSYSTIDLYGTAAVGAGGIRTLTLDAAGLAGYRVGGANAATLTADNIVFASTGSPPATFAGAPDGTGDLALAAAQRVTFGAGAKQISGFGNTRVTANESITGAGTGTLQVNGNLRLESGRLTGAAAADQKITASGVVDIAPTAAAVAAADASAGAKLAVTGSAVNVTGSVVLPAGDLTLAATAGDVTIGDALLAPARVSVAGASRTLGSETAFASGGRVTLQSATGSVRTLAGSEVDLRGAPAGGDAGRLRVLATAAGATAQIDGTVQGGAAAGFQSGAVEIDAGGIAAFGALNTRLDASGVTGERVFRVRSGDVALAAGETATARRFELSADAGRVTIAGTIDASGATGGGSVEVNASGNTTLAAGGKILAQGTSSGTGALDAPSDGGSVRLASRGAAVNFDSLASIDVSAGAKGDAGTVVFSAPRTAGNNGVVASLAGTVKGTAGAGGASGQVIVEGNRSYDAAALGLPLAGGTYTLGSAQTAGGSGTLWTQYRQFMNSVSVGAVTGAMTLQDIAPGDVHVRAGIEVTTPANLTLGSAWNLTSANWTIGGEPGSLTLRAAGTLTVNNALGFPADAVVAGPSWSLRLVGGGDLAGAKPTALLPLATLEAGNTGDVILATANSRVRTGTGNIEIAAGRDFRIANTGAVVYTTGVAKGVADDPFDPVSVLVNDRYTRGGGDITITAQRDAVGPTAQQWISDWLRRSTADAGENLEGYPAGWWVHLPNFRQNVGSFGGGDIAIAAGRNVSNLSAMSATAGRLVGQLSDGNGNPVYDGDGNPIMGASLDVTGGGNLRVAAGSNIVGGQYLVGRGAGTLRAGGAIGQTTPTVLFEMGVSGDPALEGATVRAEARGDLSLRTVANPTMLTLSLSSNNASYDDGFRSFRSNFFTYAATAGVALTSVAGNVLLDSRLPVSDPDPTWSDFYAPRLAVTALQGDIRGVVDSRGNQNKIWLYPSASGSVKLLAGGSIGNVILEATDVDPATLPQWDRSSVVFGPRPVDNQTFAFGTLAPARIVTPDADARYAYVAEAGADIYDTRLSLPRKAVIEAGRDIENAALALQNLDPADTTMVLAGRDLTYPALNRAGRVAARSSTVISGPGGLIVEAGRNIDLGTSDGILAAGDTYNNSLPTSASAQLTVAAGYTGQLFAPAVNNFFTALRAAGEAKDVAGADALIDGFFAANDTGPGSITMYFSSIKTVGGSGIDLLVPSGNINAGLTSPATRDIGIVTAQGGAVRSYLSGDFNINQSKIITLLGGDIMIYSRDGSIDAGRGALSSRTTLPPRKVVDPVTGISSYLPPQDASGSGIRTLTSDPDGPGPLLAPKPGDVLLFAPSGTVNAGEAGISSAGNVFIAALQVLNATNIQAAGTSTGVPAASTGAGVGAVGAGSVAAAASKAAEEAATASARPTTESFRPSFLTVEVLGFGV